MTTTPVSDNTKIIHPLCSLSGCWSIASGHSTDQRGHTLGYCGHDHKVAILEQRAAVYGLDTVSLCQIISEEVANG